MACAGWVVRPRPEARRRCGIDRGDAGAGVGVVTPRRSGAVHLGPGNGRDRSRDLPARPPPSRHFGSGRGDAIAGGVFAREAAASGCRYAALISSAYWPNPGGLLFDLFDQGLGFFSPGWTDWIGGTLGEAVQADPRYQDFLSINETRLRCFGRIDDADKRPLRFGGPASGAGSTAAGAELKTADAIVSGCPVIATSHALEGYGPVVAGRGVGVFMWPIRRWNIAR